MPSWWAAPWASCARPRPGSSVLPPDLAHDPALPASASDERLRALFALQRRAHADEPFAAPAVRRDRLRRLLALTQDHEAEWAAAISADFGHRSIHETRLAECYIVAAAARHALDHLDRWMRPQRVRTPLHLLPARAFLLRQPVGVVGVISPWNYPFQLALSPVVGAIAAGNRVLLKPSELTPQLSALLRERIRTHFAEDELAVVEGDATLGAAFSALPFDHLFFTGSTAVGRLIARAAAENLTPVTLELGGKSPAIVDADADLEVAAMRLMTGKLLNAGQTCIAPDYVLVPRERRDAFIDAARRAVERLYPGLGRNPDYSSILNEQHYARLQGLVDDARAKGGNTLAIGAGVRERRVLPPTLLWDADDGWKVMQEEIFGPLLPIEPFDKLDGAIARVAARPRPLAFYYFGGEASRRRRVLERTIAGGVTVNDTMWHFAHEGLPFGGIGPSGSGAYHGERGFLAFTHEKPVFVQRRLALTALLRPPYGRTFEAVVKVLRRLNT